LDFVYCKSTKPHRKKIFKTIDFVHLWRMEDEGVSFEVGQGNEGCGRGGIVS
jgi:hypothetical protein